MCESIGSAIDVRALRLGLDRELVGHALEAEHLTSSQAFVIPGKAARSPAWPSRRDAMPGRAHEWVMATSPVLGQQLEEGAAIRSQELDQPLERAIDLGVDLLRRDAREAGREIREQVLELRRVAHGRMPGASGGPPHPRNLVTPHVRGRSSSRPRLARVAQRSGIDALSAAPFRASLAWNWHNRGFVTLRITTAEEGTIRRIQVAGRLTGEEVGELEHSIGDDPSAVCLDLEELRSADEAGLAALRRLRAEGIEMRGVPPHLAWRIEVDEE